MIVTQERLNEMLQEVLVFLDEEYDLAPGEYQLSPIVKQSKAKSYHGLCKYNSRDKTACISVSKFLMYEKDIMEVLIHECLHVVFPGDCHGGYWKRYADLITKETEYSVERVTHRERSEESYSVSKKRDYKYFITCESCGRVYKYKNKSKVVKMLIAGQRGCRCKCGCEDLRLEGE